MQVKDWIITVGVVVASLGYECLPHGQSADANDNLSFFAQSADAGVFKSFGFLTLVIGVFIVVVGLLAWLVSESRNERRK
jgi:hypothetical protein